MTNCKSPAGSDASSDTRNVTGATAATARLVAAATADDMPSLLLPRLASQEHLANQAEAESVELETVDGSNVSGSSDSGGGSTASSGGYGMARLHVDSDNDSSSYARVVVSSLPPAMQRPAGRPTRLREEDDENDEVTETAYC